jgi:hypothetical protein
MTVSATFSELKVGMRIRCIYPYGNCYNRIAKIKYLDHSDMTLKVEWEDGSPDSTEWMQAASFSIIKDEVNADINHLYDDVVLVNDAVCKNCGNKRLNSSEKVCWSCTAKQ